MSASRPCVFAIALLLAAPVLLASPSGADAQPGEWTQGPPAPAATIVLTPDEHALLRRGEISSGEHIAGGLLGTFVGYGSGHIAQGRWADKGWIFTLGEGASAAVLVTALTSCTLASAEGRARENRCIASLVGAAVVHTGFRIWELIDVWAEPTKHNNRVRQLRLRTGQFRPRYGVYAAPTGSHSGVAGVSIQF